MADEARSSNDFGKVRYQADSVIAPYEVRQGPTGLAEVHDKSVPATQFSYPTFATTGQFKFQKASGVVLLKGCPVFWDHSANVATFRRTGDRDFYLGLAVEDAASTGPTVEVDLNRFRRSAVDLFRDGFVSVVTGTQALAGLLPPQPVGGGYKFVLSSVNEAQKVDALGRKGFAYNSNPILRARVTVNNGGAGAAPDLNIGAADGTHATDADSIANSALLHLNGNDVNLYAESDDALNETAATDTTVNYTAGTEFELWIDFRNPADVQFYIDAVLVLDGSTFNVSNFSGVWYPLIHLEKTAAADVFDVDVHEFEVWTAEQ